MRTLISIMCLLMLTGQAYAAELQLFVPDTPAPSGPVSITVVLNTEGENINAIEGSLVVPREAIVREIRDGNSAVNFWIERPHDTDGTIRFAGITPGGIVSEGALIFTLIFDAKERDIHLNLTNAKAYRNDGEGTEVTLSLNTAIKPQTKEEEKKDASPPEEFTISLSSDSSLFEGKPFIIFAAQDKQSGIDYYEICEGIFSGCVRGESPYLLQIGGNALITVRAFDRDGNIRLARLFTPEAKGRYALYGFLGILILVSAAMVLRRKSAFLR